MTTDAGKFPQKDAPANTHKDVSPRTDKAAQSPSQGGHRDTSVQKTMPTLDKKAVEIPPTSKL